MPKAKDLITERTKTHGTYASQAEVTQAIIWLADSYGTEMNSNVLRDAFCMIATKLGRIITGDPMHKDHWEDIAGYATLAARECDASS